MKSNLASKKDTSRILDEVGEQWGMELPRAKNIMVHQIHDDAQIITGAGTKILRVGGDYLPFLSETDMLGRFPRIVVDMGAVRFMCKGANVMRPGIVEYGEFAAGGIVCVAEESQRKFLAVGKALVDSSGVGGMERGEVARNIHYISDRFWEIGKTIRD